MPGVGREQPIDFCVYSVLPPPLRSSGGGTQCSTPNAGERRATDTLTVCRPWGHQQANTTTPFGLHTLLKANSAQYESVPPLLGRSTTRRAAPFTTLQPVVAEWFSLASLLAAGCTPRGGTARRSARGDPPGACPSQDKWHTDRCDDHPTRAGGDGAAAWPPLLGRRRQGGRWEAALAAGAWCDVGGRGGTWIGGRHLWTQGTHTRDERPGPRASAAAPYKGQDVGPATAHTQDTGRWASV